MTLTLLGVSEGYSQAGAPSEITLSQSGVSRLDYHEM